MAELTDVPASLIVKADKPYIEVFCSSETEGNPSNAGDRKKMYGLYCEYVIEKKAKLLVPNALKDPDWEDNPDVDRGMIAYLGYPLLWPTGEVFGTLCILDNEENHFSKRTEKLLELFKELVETQLEQIYKETRGIKGFQG